MFHLLYDIEDNECLVTDVNSHGIFVAVYKEASSGKIWNSFKDTASKTFTLDYNTVGEHISNVIERNNFILLTTQASLEEVQSFIRASPELLI